MLVCDTKSKGVCRLVQVYLDLDMLNMYAMGKGKNINLDKYKGLVELSTVYKLCEKLEVDQSDIVKDYVESFEDINVKQYENQESFIKCIPKEKTIKKYSVLELFAGAGGMLLGFEKAGFQTRAAIEIDKHACNTLRENYPELEVLEGDIDKFIENGDLEKYKGVDVVTGGFPCQSFSYAGKRRGLDDARGTLFYSFAKALEITQPKMFVAENVKGLVSHDQGNTLKLMILVFEKMGYDITYRVLNAMNYGVAQKRERIFIIGVRKDLKEEEFKYPEPLNYVNLLIKVLKDVPESAGKVYPEKKYKVLEMVPPGGCWRDLPVDIQKEYMMKSYYLGGGKTGMARRLSWFEPSLTLTTAPDMKQTERCHPDETRPLTIREYARIQDFPDEWNFTGPITAQYKQIGNAVPVGLAEYIGLAVFNYLNKIS